jgi:hypothetical protein
LHLPTLLQHVFNSRHCGLYRHLPVRGHFRLVFSQSLHPGREQEDHRLRHKFVESPFVPFIHPAEIFECRAGYPQLLVLFRCVPFGIFVFRFSQVQICDQTGAYIDAGDCQEPVCVFLNPAPLKLKVLWLRHCEVNECLQRKVPACPEISSWILALESNFCPLFREQTFGHLRFKCQLPQVS